MRSDRRSDERTSNMEGGKRKRRRPITRWKDCIVTNWREKGLNNVIQDRTM